MARALSLAHDKTIRVWDARTGDTVAGPFEGHTDSVSSVAFSPDGMCIVSGSFDKTIRVWDACTGDTVAGPFEGHTDLVWSAAFSPDGTRIVSGSKDKTIRVWDARTGDTVVGPFEGHIGQVRSVAFSPDGTRIVSSSWDQTIRVWDAQTGDPVAESPTDISVIASPPFSSNHVPSNILSIGPFKFEQDGWIITHNVLLFWISPQFRTQLPYPCNTLVIGPRGTTLIDYRRPSLCIGKTWSDCYPTVISPN
jgi:WD40 repeat protein